MRALTIALVALLGLTSVASCEDPPKEEAPVAVPGGGPKGAPQAAEPVVPAVEAPTADPTAIPEDEAAATCIDWCTLVAGCWEKVNEGEYTGGGQCEAVCARRPAAERRAFGDCVMQKTGDCKAMLDC